MKCYIDITLLPSADITLYFLWEKLYQQLHLALVETQNTSGKVSVGIAFQEYDETQNQLGNQLRLFSPNRETLEGLQLQKWLSRLTDYLHITDMRDVPEKVERYACFQRIQPKSSNARLARRKAKRESISLEEALAYFQSNQEQTSQLPFVKIKSHSSGQRFRLVIARTDANNLQIADGFSTYGLSSKSSLPVF